jgi:hypothetical protein
MPPNISQDRTERFDKARAVEEAGALAAILDALAQLLVQLDRLRQEQRLAAVPEDDRIAVWSDQNHLYIEGHPPEPVGGTIDVSLHAETLFIRMEL